jgi:hypothetical protein
MLTKQKKNNTTTTYMEVYNAVLGPVPFRRFLEEEEEETIVLYYQVAYCDDAARIEYRCCCVLQQTFVYCSSYRFVLPLALTFIAFPTRLWPAQIGE